VTNVRIEVDPPSGTATVWNDDVPYVLFGVHNPGTCAGEFCVLHNPSNHEYRDSPLLWDHGKFWRGIAGFPGAVEDPDSLAFRESMKGPRVQCMNCGQVIQSTHRHDFVTCKCKATSIDGGSDYTRILGSQWGFFSDPPESGVQ